MVGFGVAVSFEMRQAAVGRAVGVAHDQHAFGLMQANRHADLFEDEVLFEVVTRRGQGLGSAGDDDHIGALDTLLLQELSHGRADAVIEAAENGGVSYVLIGGRVKMEDLAHERSLSILPCATDKQIDPGRRTRASAPTWSPTLRVLFLARLTTARCGLLFPGRRGGLLRRRPGVELWLLR